MTYITTTSTVGQQAATAPQIKISNGTNTPDVSTQSLINNSPDSPVVQASQPAQSKASVSFSNAAGDWHMEFYHPETGEVVERFPAKQVANTYQNSTRSRG